MQMAHAREKLLLMCLGWNGLDMEQNLIKKKGKFFEVKCHKMAMLTRLTFGNCMLCM